MNATATVFYTLTPDCPENIAPYSHFDNECEYRLALTTVIDLAKDRLLILDHDLHGTGLDTKPLCETLGQFLKKSATSELYIAVHDTAFLLSSSSRLRSLLQNHTEQIAVRQIPDTFRHLSDSHLLADGIHGVRRFHKSFPRGALIVNNPSETGPWWRRFDELWEQCPAPISVNRVLI